MIWNIHFKIHNVEIQPGAGGKIARSAGTSVTISGIDGISLTKLDVLDELEEIKMCVAYKLHGEQIER